MSFSRLIVHYFSIEAQVVEILTLQDISFKLIFSATFDSAQELGLAITNIAQF